LFNELPEKGTILRPLITGLNMTLSFPHWGFIIVEGAMVSFMEMEKKELLEQGICLLFAIRSYKQ